MAQGEIASFGEGNVEDADQWIEDKGEEEGQEDEKNKGLGKIELS
jgi:hypothetical protein